MHPTMDQTNYMLNFLYPLISLADIQLGEFMLKSVDKYSCIIKSSLRTHYSHKHVIKLMDDGCFEFSFHDTKMQGCIRCNIFLMLCVYIIFCMCFSELRLVQYSVYLGSSHGMDMFSMTSGTSSVSMTSSLPVILSCPST